MNRFGLGLTTLFVAGTSGMIVGIPGCGETAREFATVQGGMGSVAGSSSGGDSGIGGTTSGVGGRLGPGSAGAHNDGGASGAAGANNSFAGADNSAAGADNSTAGAAGSADQGQACNALTFSGTMGKLVPSSAAVPTLQNGTFQPGDYRLTSGTIYGGGTGGSLFGEIAHVSVVGPTATIQLADNGGATRTIVIVMGQPSSVPPSSIKLTCDTDPIYKPYVGMEAKSANQYGVDGNTFSLYEAPVNALLVFTLEP